MARALPARVHLPSGRVVALSDGAARAAAAVIETGAGGARAPACVRDVSVLEGGGGAPVVTDEGGAPVDVRALPLRDAHVLRALLAAAEVVPEERGEFSCENCGAAFEVAPSALLEIGPFADGELGDPELDRPFDFDAWHRVPALRVGGAICRRARLAPRTLEEAMPLLRRAEAKTLRITPAVVTAMGVVALGGVWGGGRRQATRSPNVDGVWGGGRRTEERRASVIADALASAPDDAWAAIVDLYHDAHYPPRLAAVHRCAACGARNDLDVPLERELPREPLREPSRARPAGEPFPDLDAFEAKVRAAADRIYEARGVRNIDLFIDAGVPACDDGGEPLLGCYTPGGADAELGIPRPPEVRIFYRTFEAERRADPGFDVDAEIEETIDHELTHHLHHLAGSDPLDDEEREAIEVEHVRRVGVAEAGRRARRGALAEAAGFLRATWPVWALVAAVTALAWCSGTSF